MHPSSLRVQTDKDKFKNCHICDVTDIICAYPLHEYPKGQLAVARVIDDKNVTLRKSIVLGGFPQNMQEILKRYGDDEKKGDYRCRIDTIGSASLKLDTVAFGYVKNYTEKGCFISLSRNFEARVELSELSDTLIADKAKIFSGNKIVLCRLINSKVKQGEKNTLQFDTSLRESVVRRGYPLNDEILLTGVGLTVTGTVTAYTKGKALVRLNNSRFTGIISLHDIEGAEEQTIEKAMPLGQVVTCKITEYSKEGEKRLIRLSNKEKAFKKFEGMETTFEEEPRVKNLWVNFEALREHEVPVAMDEEIE